MLETTIEKKVCNYAKKKGFYAVKFKDPSQRGAPDRLLASPAGTVFFIEFKRFGELPRAEQLRYHKKLKKYDLVVWVVDTVADGKKVIDRYASKI